VTIAPCIYLVHRRPSYGPNPEQFNPDRFLEARQSPYTFFPFGGGPADAWAQPSRRNQDEDRDAENPGGEWS